MTAGQVTAPFTDEQVAALNAFQHLPHVHPFTCAVDGHDEPLVASRFGWHCPRLRCLYEQRWAHAFMAHASLHPPGPLAVLFNSNDDEMDREIENGQRQ